jgi:penicillin amidase
MKQPLRITRALLSAAVAALLVVVSGTGLGPLPALGSVLDPATGVWASAAGGVLPHSGELKLDGLTAEAKVTFDADGVPDVSARSDADLFLTLGYLHARFRLSELDLNRRLGEGRLAEIQGPAGVSSDKFELALGLLRTARAEWASIPPGSPAHTALLAYARGVNDSMAETIAAHRLPAMYTLAGVTPAPWTPVDSLVTQGVLTQTLDFSTNPLQHSILTSALGSDLARRLFPDLPPNAQAPYDPGPYRAIGTAPLPVPNANAADPAAAGSPAPQAPGGNGPVPEPAGAPAPSGLRLPAQAVHVLPDSNAWAANGPLVAGGGAMLAGDPHLPTTLPSIWYQAALHSPGYEVTGASYPGVPGIVLGRNQHVSWSVTDGQNQSTLYYREQTSPDHPGRYYWRGAWRTMETTEYTIPVRGAAPVPWRVDRTSHGPVMTLDGQTVSVSWMGNLPSPDVAAILAIDVSRDSGELRAALRSWVAPTLNFVYADDSGTIGAIAPGVYPLVASGDASLPLPGTGESDIAGTIPFDAVPQVRNPPGHFVVSANQRQTGPGYPYYLGPAAGFDNGYRAREITRYLSTHRNLGPADFQALQLSVTDNLAGEIVPVLLSALGGAPLTPGQGRARDLLAGWSRSMDAASAAATVWWQFWNDYLATVFQPYWDAARVPVSLDGTGLAASLALVGLNQNLEQWTLHDPGNPLFSPPGTTGGTATTALRTAFGRAVTELGSKLGPDPAAWAWGRVHTRIIPSISGTPGLGYGPWPSGGDAWTVDAADGGLQSAFGPSLRLVVSWSPGGGPAVTGTVQYPGGQSEHPGSPWYETFIPDWIAGRYRPLRLVADPRDAVAWTLRPTGAPR